MKKIKKKINTILSNIHLLCLFAIILIFANKVEANTDSLKQVWTNVAQPDSIRFKAINTYYKKNLFAQPDSVILLTAYHLDLADQKHSRKERAKALDNKAKSYIPVSYTHLTLPTKA